MVPSPSTVVMFREYLADLVAWHGYVRFLGLPTYQNNPDVPIEELYVPHLVSDSYLSPDSDPSDWKTRDPIHLLSERKRLVVLGDPGSGKSTLVNWLAWYLASGFSRPLPGDLSGLLPVPLVLRDLELQNVHSFEGLIDAFLSRPVARGLKAHGDLLLEYLRAGSVLLLVDGMDEVAADIQKTVRNVLEEGLAQYPIYTLCTSRIVGYESLMPAHGEESEEKGRLPAERARPEISADKPRLDVVYVAPFTDEQIGRFALNWYHDQGGSEHEARLLRDEFVLAIRSNESTLRLARTPNLLTMMALVYRVRARLPSGRALLYEDIAQAYLESIDTARKLKDEFSWKSKKRWLARVGFEMQLRRNHPKRTAGRELLIDRQEVLQWVSSAIREAGDSAQEDYAEKYLDWITRRSGLLIPRGQDQFAFLHLSFQEYFAAVYVKQQLEHPEWPASHAYEGGPDTRVSRRSVEAWSGESRWSQPFIFLFELCAEQPGWTKKLASLVFPQKWAEKKRRAPAEYENPTPARAHLLLDLLSNPHGGFTASHRAGQMAALEKFSREEQAWCANRIERGIYYYYQDSRTLLSGILSTSVLRSFGLSWLQDQTWKSLVLDGLDASALEPVLDKLSLHQDLFCLSLRTTEFADCARLSSLTKLRHLALDRTRVSNVRPLATLCDLEVLRLENTEVDDLAGVLSCKKLRSLSLDGTRLADLGPIANFPELQDLAVGGSKISSVAPLQGLTKMRNLSLHRTQVSDLGPLEGLVNLEFLVLDGAAITDLRPISTMKNLNWLGISQTGVTDLSALREMSRLQFLTAMDTGVSDISPLAATGSLMHLLLDGSPVVDLSPLSRLGNLRYLSLSRTNVEDLRPLSGLKSLIRLAIAHTKVKDLSPIVRCNLSELVITGAPVADFTILGSMSEETNVIK